MTRLPIPAPRVRGLVCIGKRSGKQTQLRIQEAVILMVEYEGVSSPHAIMHASAVYFPEPVSPAIQRAINEFYPDMPHCRVSGSQFDFTVGAALTSAGLPLTQRTES